MGERKVLNRYFPPDFDPLLVPKRKWDPYKQVEVRMMIPFSLQCVKCGEYMYRGKKFNSRKEDVVGDTYLGIRKYRFYIKCCVCSNEIAFKTDPQNQDYVCESGATRNFESWRQQSDKEKVFEDERKEGADANVMAALESRTLDSKIEMDILDALDEIKAYNERHERVDRAELGAGAKSDAAALTAAEDAEVAAFAKLQRNGRAKSAAADAAAPLPGSSSDDDGAPGAPPAGAPPAAGAAHAAAAPPPPPPRTKGADAALGAKLLEAGARRKAPPPPPKAPVVKRKLAGAAAAPAVRRKVGGGDPFPPPAPKPPKPPAPAPAATGFLGLGGYGSTSGSDAA